jgi:hypothetical protein
MGVSGDDADALGAQFWNGSIWKESGIEAPKEYQHAADASAGSTVR